jgi:hypothetical protein
MANTTLTAWRVRDLARSGRPLAECRAGAAVEVKQFLTELAAGRAEPSQERKLIRALAVKLKAASRQLNAQEHPGAVAVFQSALDALSR